MQNTDLTQDLESVVLGIDAFDDEIELSAAHLHNALSLLHQVLGEGSWVGLYLATPTRLILGPFQGTPACEKIAFGKGVVGECYSSEKTITVKDVTKRANYICCDAAAKSEICVPMKKDGRLVAVLDVDLPYVHECADKEIVAFEKIAAKLLRFC